MIEVFNKVKIYEINGEDTNYNDNTILVVKSNWIDDKRIIIEYNGMELTVVASDLQDAIKNATNTSRW